MITAQALAETGILSHDAIMETLVTGLGGKFTGQKVLVLIPDHTRSLPLPALFRMVVDVLHDGRELNVMVALGTHPGYSEEGLNRLVGITAEERATTFRHVGLLNHAWDHPAALTSLGVLEQDEVRQLAGPYWHPLLPDRVDIRVNKAVLEHDHIVIVGPTFPHEVVGFSGGAKYFFPGICGPDVINATHWLDALATVVGTIGIIKNTPVRAMIHAAASRLKTPSTLVALIVEDHDLAGVLIGDLYETWSAAADVSARRHILWFDKPFTRVLSRCPPMYDELWTAGKCMYKIELVVAVGGEGIIYAPHLEVVSHVHGKVHLRGGLSHPALFPERLEALQARPAWRVGPQHPRARFGRDGERHREAQCQADPGEQIPPEGCARLNLGYMDPARINPADWQDREDEGILYVPKAGERLYKVRSQP
ncbi:MAG: lactate racemase domain-containing protein [Caldilineales bacterium]|nr:lactate racemase domain-containing protein [Caldilineales bacterium]